MANCINHKHPDVVKMAGELNISPVVLAAKIGVWQEKNNIIDRFPTIQEIQKPQEVNYGLKSFEILSSDKAKQVFEKGKKNNWDLNKILTELQIPKEQKQLILDLGITDREQLALELASNYSYAVEINTGEAVIEKMKEVQTNVSQYYSPSEDRYYRYTEELGWISSDKDNKNQDHDVKTPNDLEPFEYNSEYIPVTEKIKSDFYSNLTVPGGTNYTENEISTPAITPSIKGHAQFATDNGIGWFRSDKQHLGKKSITFDEWYSKVKDRYKDTPLDVIKDIYEEEVSGLYPSKVTETKTRRILELQSDLFQKGRDKKYLDSKNDESGAIFTLEDIGQENIETNSNKFLQLLNKDNNWVTFFIKSIIQDSVKKGYEKVLFPSGNTASKVEGHTTLEEFKKQKEDRIKELEKQKKGGIEIVERYLTNDNNEPYSSIDVKIDDEINQLKQELERVETEGFGALKPIYNFYENTVTNILKKQGYNPTLITDEYGNTWNEIILDNTRDESTILFNKIEELLDINNKNEIFNINDNLNSKSLKKDNTQSNIQLLFNSENLNSFKVNDVLNNIILQNSNNQTENFNKLLEKSKNILNNSNAKVEVDTLENMSKKYKDVDNSVAMLYDSDTNKIVISKEALERLNSEEIIQSFIHEVVHAITIKSLKSPQTFEEREVKEFFEKAFDQYKYLASQRSNKKESYGFTNVEEFIAELYSNPEFQNEIKEIEGFWKELKDIIRRLLGLTKTLKNDELIDAVLLINKVEEYVENTNNSNFKGFSFEGGLSFDAMFIKFEDFAKDNKINPEIITKINSLIDNSNFIKLSDDNKTYINTKTGKKYNRVTNYIIDSDKKENDLLTTASNLGNKVDIFVRDYFDDNLQSFESYNLSSKKELYLFKKQLDELNKIIKSNGEIVLAKNITLYNDELSLAGTIDLMTVDKKGNIKIYDIKSMKGNQLEDSYKNDTSVKYDSKKFGSSKREIHQKQLSLYRILLNNTNGLLADEIAVIPVELDYEVNDTTSKKVNLLNIIPVTPLSKVKDAYLNKEKTNRISVLKKVEGYNLETIEKQIENILNKAKDILDQNIAYYKSVSKSSKDKTKWNKFVGNFSTILESLESIEEGKELEAILLYIKSMKTNISNLKYSFENKDFTDEETIKVINNYSKYLDSFSIHKDIQVLLSNIKSDKKLNIDLKEFEDNLSIVIADYNLLKNEYTSYLRKALKLKLSNLKYLPELETMWVNKLKEEYKLSPKNISQKEWIAYSINNTYKDDINADIEQYLNQLINNPSFDISIATHYFNDSINTNSHLIQIFNQILNEIKEEINSKMREKEMELLNAFNKLSKEKNSTNPAVLYKNLLTTSPRGNLSLVINTEKLSETEKLVLKLFKEIQDQVDKVTFKKQSKIYKDKYIVNGKKIVDVYYELPSISKSDLERLLSGDIKGTIKDKWTDLTTIKTDDVEFRYKTDNEYNILYNVPIRYRGDIDTKDQSINLFTVYRLEFLNGLNYKVKTKAENDLQTILDIAKTKEYYRTQGTKDFVKSVFNKRNQIALTKGEDSNTVKKLQSLLEQNIYDIGNHYAGKLGPIDINKAISFTNGLTASIGLNLNRFAATANVLNAKAQMFLETISKGTINKSNLAKAEALYAKELPNTMKDLGESVEKSFINQMNRMFDTFGFNQDSMNDFVKQGLLKSYANLGSLQFMHKGGEHWVQSVLTAAVLDSVKVMNAENKFIDKNGKITTEQKAASLLDMLYIDEKDGLLKISDHVVYTTKSLSTKINEGGKEKINLLIKRKIFDCFGNYDKNTQPEAKRHWWGKLVLMFRGFYVEMLTRRTKGISNSFVSKDEIENNPLKYKNYNYALQEYDEGTYTSLIRFVRHGIIPMLKQMKLDIMSKEWNKLSDLEKSNIKHSLAEITATLVLLPLIGILLGGLLDGDDDDEYIYFWMYQTRRLTTELAQFRNPSENIKMTRSPIPSMRIIEQSLDALSKTLNPFAWDERIESGPNKGDLKVQRAWEKLIPVLNQFDKKSEDLYNYQKAMFGIY